MRAAGYNVVYKGKWHCSKPARKKTRSPPTSKSTASPRWNPPDAGANQSVPEAGGGFIDNDGRFIESVGTPEAGAEGVLQYLELGRGQTAALLHGDLAGQPARRPLLPEQDLRRSRLRRLLAGGRHRRCRRPTKKTSRPSPRSRNSSSRSSTSPASRKPRSEKRAYLNYYGNLMRSSDNYLVNVLDKLEETGLYDDTLIVRTADHGEMGLTHGGMRQKNFNFYEEATRVPLVYSNPKLFPKPAEHRRAGLPRRLPADPGQPRGGAESGPRQLAGGGLLEAGPAAEDAQAGPGLRRLHLRRLPVGPEQAGPTRNRRTTSSASAKGAGSWPSTTTSEQKNPVPPQWEMYDLKTDPLEKNNLAYQSAKRTPKQEEELQRLKRKLAKSERRGCGRAKPPMFSKESGLPRRLPSPYHQLIL